MIDGISSRFGWPDYFVFVLMLVSCSLVGIYFGFIEKKSKKGKSIDESDYLVGGRKMKVVPISMSLIASAISAITLLGTPTEIYVHGTQYCSFIFSIMLMGIAMTYFYLPVFHDLQLTSTYQYLESRFDRRVRIFGALLFVIGSMTWLPIVIYVPALALNQVTGANVHMITPIVCLVCIFYTCVGGMKAVVWTDVIQLTIMCGAIILVIVKGSIDVGGFGFVWDKAVESGRIELPATQFDLEIRHSIYSIGIGGFIHTLKSNAVSQNMIQRYLSLPTLAAARKALWIKVFGSTFFIATSSYCGLLIYATYHDCDPLTTKLAKVKDQLMPLLVMRTLGDYPGLPGVFVAGVFSASLSSLSTALNSMSAVVLEDFAKNIVKKPLTERQTHYIMRGVVAVFGTICVCLVFLVEKLGTVLQLAFSVGAVSNGPLLGIFTIGILIPWISGLAAMIGGATSLSFMFWLCFRAQAAIVSGELFVKPKPTFTHGCDYNFIRNDALNMLAINQTIAPSTIIDDSNAADNPDFAIYRISYMWYTLLGALITIIVATIISSISGFNNPREMNPKLFAPIMRKVLRLDERREIAIETAAEHSSCVDLKALP